MKTAFGQAMMDGLKDPSVEFFMRSQLSASGVSCAPYLNLRTEEEQLIASLALPSQSRVLDFGCGLGRHLKAISQTFPDAHPVGIEKCDLLRQHCQENIEGALFYASLDELEGQKFDLILLMGNGLGIFGSEEQAKAGLARMNGLLTEHGQIVFETGHPIGSGYRTESVGIEYAGEQDGPFDWGVADASWIEDVFSELGQRVELFDSQAPGLQLLLGKTQKS